VLDYRPTQAWMCCGENGKEPTHGAAQEHIELTDPYGAVTFDCRRALVSPPASPPADPIPAPDPTSFLYAPLSRAPESMHAAVSATHTQFAHTMTHCRHNTCVLL